MTSHRLSHLASHRRGDAVALSREVAKAFDKVGGSYAHQIERSLSALADSVTGSRAVSEVSGIIKS